VTTIRGAIVLALMFFAVSSAAAQRHEIATVPAQVVLPWRWDAAHGPQVTSLRPFFPDSTAIRPTHWLAGAVVGGVLVGLAGSGLCDMDGSGSVGCHLAAFTLFGGAIGVPLGALIGGLFPRSP